MAQEPVPESDAAILPFPGARGPASTDELRLRDVVGEVLREERHRQGRTLTDVAREASVSVPYLSEVERGRKEVSSDVLEAIHGALGLDLAQVLGRATHRLLPGTQHRGPSLLAA